MQKDELDALSLDVFRTFARCEYALKAAGFRSATRNEVKADWRAFARALGEVFDRPADPELAAAVNYLLQQPPRKQVIRDGQLEWVTCRRIRSRIPISCSPTSAACATTFSTGANSMVIGSSRNAAGSF